MHSFSFFLGQALGPILVGVGMDAAGVEPTLTLCALTLAVLGPAMAVLFARARARAGGSRAF
jgi:hypothetical protein